MIVCVCVVFPCDSTSKAQSSYLYIARSILYGAKEVPYKVRPIISSEGRDKIKIKQFETKTFIEITIQCLEALFTVFVS